MNERQPPIYFNNRFNQLLISFNEKCEKFHPVSTFLCPKYMKVCFYNSEHGKEDKNGCR